MINAIRISFATILFMMTWMITAAQTLASFEVDLAKATNGIDFRSSSTG
jgi:hypothetical protein